MSRSTTGFAAALALLGCGPALLGCAPRVSAQLPADDPAAAAQSSEAPPAVIVEVDGAALEAPKPSAPVNTGQAATEIANLREQGASSEWDDAVTVIMLRNYDTDRSGSLDRPEEIEAISCSVYLALDDGVTGGSFGSSVTAIYGFDFDYIWVGNALGFDEGQHRLIALAMKGCGLPFSVPIPGP